MTNWYTADTHFGHESVIGFCDRPFANASQMDVTLIENLHAHVTSDDDLWILGDFTFGPKAKEAYYLSEIFGQLPGTRIHLIVGNHDQAATLALPWDSISHIAEVRDGPKSQAHTLCHYPMITWNHAGRQALQLFDHVHYNWQGSRNSVNVRVDVWDFRPMQFEDIALRTQTLPINKHWDEVERNT
ncbi:metallophosphoesterase [uncultured Roseobacter sp.]|uniref:metallophosphoesterase n=1 Tax=uncultured Roseobacter sp. TaxID=114847 RepID=UPI002604B4AB|nr:metallophosphoesterase [uncultured Roseobacter sp.]